MKILHILPILIAPLLFVACSDSESGTDTKTTTKSDDSSSAASATIVTLTAPDSDLDPAKLGSATVSPHPLPERFPAAASADALIITVGSTGLRPLDKGHLALAGFLKPAKTIVVMMGSDAVGSGSADDSFDQSEWLNEKAKEIEEAAQALGAEGVMIAVDSPEAKGDIETKGWEAVLAAAEKATPGNAPERTASESLEVTITLPKGSESHAPHALKSIKDGNDMDFVFPTGEVGAECQVEATISTGSTGSAVLQLEEPIETAVGDKFVVTRMGTVIGYGEVNELN